MKLKKWTLIFILPVLFLLFLNSSVFADEIMRFAYYDSAPPGSWKENTQMKGFYVDIVNEIVEKRLNIPVSHEGHPWKRVQKMVENGDSDAFITLPNPSREKYAEFSSESVYVMTRSIFTRIDHPEIQQFKNITDLNDFKNFTHVSYLGSGWVNNTMRDKGFKIHEVARFSQIFEVLAKGRGDYALTTKIVGKYLIKTSNLEDKIICIDSDIPVLKGDSFCLGISKKSSFLKILPAWENELKKTKQDGTYQSIFNKYQ